MRQPGVSVVMATFNGERFIGNQLRTLAAQTSSPVELVIGDDGSTDRTLEIVSDFAQHAPFPVRVHRNETRLGYGENFLNACDVAAGELIAFCDQDDLWRRDKLERAVAALNESDAAALFVHGAELIDENGRPLKGFLQGIRRRRSVDPLGLPPWGVFYGFSMVFRQELLDVIDRSERGRHTWEHQGQLSHDLWVYFLAQSLSTTVLDPTPLVRYRQHTNNVTPLLTGAWFRRFTTQLGKAVDPALPREEIAEHRARILSALAGSSPDPAVQHRASAAARYWREVAVSEERRIPVYMLGSPSARAGAWAELLRSRGYRHLGSRLLLKDLLAGVGGLRRRG